MCSYDDSVIERFDDGEQTLYCEDCEFPWTPTQRGSALGSVASKKFVATQIGKELRRLGLHYRYQDRLSDPPVGVGFEVRQARKSAGGASEAAAVLYRHGVPQPSEIAAALSLCRDYGTVEEHDANTWLIDWPRSG